MGRRPDPADAPDGDALRRAKALSSSTRRSLVSALTAAGAPMTAQELAAPLGVHHTAVRQHMAVLAQAGLVAVVQLPPEGRGRPKVAYRATGEPDPYQRLAGMLADAAADRTTPREAGRRHGRAIALAGDDPVAVLTAETERLGFRPRVADRRGTIELVLQACPFADVAATAPQVVCELHRGIAEGVAEATGGLEVVDLRAADPRTAGCRLVTRRIT